MGPRVYQPSLQLPQRLPVPPWEQLPTPRQRSRCGHAVQVMAVSDGPGAAVAYAESSRSVPSGQPEVPLWRTPLTKVQVAELSGQWVRSMSQLALPGSESRSASHSIHLALPVTAAYRPATQSWHVFEPDPSVDENCPEVHLVQVAASDAPVTSLQVPAAHSVQSDSCTLLEFVT